MRVHLIHWPCRAQRGRVPPQLFATSQGAASTPPKRDQDRQEAESDEDDAEQGIRAYGESKDADGDHDDPGNQRRAAKAAEVHGGKISGEKDH